MAFTNATVRASSSCAVSGAFPPQGVVSATDPLNDTEIAQRANTQVSNLTFGTGGGQVDLITCSDRTLSAAADVAYDLYAGTDLKTLDGFTCAFRRVKYVKVQIVTGGDASGVRVGGATSQPWPAFFADASDRSLIFPGGPAFEQGSPAGVAVGPTTGSFRIQNAGAVAVTVRVVVAGTSV